MMTEEEFKEFYDSMTDEEKIELNRKLVASAKENRELFNLSEEFVDEFDEKTERYAELAAQKKQARELLHSVETQLDLVEQRMKARMLDESVSLSPQFYDDDKNKGSH
jgi:chromosome segregation ATPase